MSPSEKPSLIPELSINRKTTFEKILPILKYIGFIGATITSLIYLIIVIVMIVGFEAQADKTMPIVFAVVNAGIGLIITQMLKLQGVSFAQSLPENKKISDEYYKSETKDKKYRSINYFWTTSVIKDILFKGVSITFSTMGLIYIVIKGSEDLTLLLMALANLLMFICFGLLALNRAYEFYNTRHVPYMLHQLELRIVEKDPGPVEMPASGTENTKAVLETKGDAQ